MDMFVNLRWMNAPHRGPASIGSAWMLRMVFQTVSNDVTVERCRTQGTVFSTFLSDFSAQRLMYSRPPMCALSSWL